MPPIIGRRPPGGDPVHALIAIRVGTLTVRYITCDASCLPGSDR